MPSLVVRHRRRLIVVVACGLAIAALPLMTDQHVNGRVLSWQALLPTALTLGTVLITGRIVLSLFVGVLTGSVLCFGFVDALPSGLRQFVWSNVIDPWHLYICGFALLVLGMVKVIEASGALLGLVQLAGRKLQSARATKLGSFVAGLLVFFDDYANTFLVGSCARPLADRHGVSREKLAYIVDSTAAPVAGLVVVSTWLSYELGLLEANTVGLELEHRSYALLLQALPFRFYCLFALSLVFISSVWERDLGPMVHAERRAAREAPKSSVSRPTHSAEQQLSLWGASAAVLPIVVLVVGVVGGMLYDGGWLSSPLSWRDPARFGQALVGADHPEIVLFRAALASLCVALVTTLWWTPATLRHVASAFAMGVRTGAKALLILFAAWGLGDASKELAAGPFLVASLDGVLPGQWLAVLTFLIAAGVAFATGTSFGTMGILLPAVLPLAHGIGGEQLLILALAAVLDGAIFGDHCSPVSDTTVLSSTACECDVMAHVKTQLPYALLAMVAAGLALSTVSLSPGVPWWALYLGGVTLLIVGLRTLGKPLQPTSERVDTAG